VGLGRVAAIYQFFLRLWLGEVRSQGSSSYPDHTSLLETISVLETQIDDLNQTVGYVFEAFTGAVDVFTRQLG